MRSLRCTGPHPRGGEPFAFVTRRNLHEVGENLASGLVRILPGNAIGLMRLEQALQPGRPRLHISRRARDDRHQLRNGVVHGRADGSGRAVHLLERWRHALEKRQGALRVERRVFLGDLLDLGDGLPHARDRRLRFSAEGAAAEARLELPLV